jgi:uncharacterized membrane protein YczE
VNRPLRSHHRRIPPSLALSRAGAVAVSLPAAGHTSLRLRTRLALLAVGSALVAIGVAGLLWTGLGPGPLDVFITSVVHRWGVPITLVVWGVAVVMMGIATVLGRRPGPGTLLLPLLSGALLPVAMRVLDRWTAPDGITFGGVTAHVAAIGVIGLGAGSVLVAELGAGTGELLAAAASTRLGRPEPLVRTGFELTWLAFGIALGGVFGPGTVLVAVLIGPAVRVGRSCVHSVLEPAGAGTDPPEREVHGNAPSAPRLPVLVGPGDALGAGD